MNTIESLEKDIFSQVECLNLFKPWKKLTQSQLKNSIFCGSGDSLAACLLAEAYSSLDTRAVDPLDLLKNKTIPKKKNVYIVSISGRTISNIKVAKLARQSITITSNPKSKLAKVSKKVIPLQFPNSDVFTAGTISFLDSALTCISLVFKIKIKNPQKIFNQAQKLSKQIKLKNRIFFLGNLHTYPLALYGAAKLYEIIGAPAYYERIEQFSHMELFSVNPGDTVIIFEEKNKHNQILVKNLKKSGLNVIQPLTKRTDKISQFLFFTFFSQLVPFFIAKKRDKKECHFVTSKKLRNVSDSMIY